MRASQGTAGRWSGVHAGLAPDRLTTTISSVPPLGKHVADATPLTEAVQRSAALYASAAIGSLDRPSPRRSGHREPATKIGSQSDTAAPGIGTSGPGQVSMAACQGADLRIWVRGSGIEPVTSSVSGKSWHRRHWRIMFTISTRPSQDVHYSSLVFPGVVTQIVTQARRRLTSAPRRRAGTASISNRLGARWHLRGSRSRARILVWE